LLPASALKNQKKIFQAVKLLLMEEGIIPPEL